MPATADWRFDVFRVDVGNACVWRGEQALKLTPKAFAVLRYFLEHAGQLVTREELWRDVWQGVSVTDAALNMCIIEVRKALGDNAKTPRFIETVHRRGYRFIAPLTPTPPPVPSSKFRVPSHSPPLTAKQENLLFFNLEPGAWNLERETSFVGRETELIQLQGSLEKAINGERQIIFVTGEPGIGKTALIDAFLSRIRKQGRGNGAQESLTPDQPLPDARSLMPSLCIARGYCVESYGAGEAYLPVLTALDALSRTVGRDQILSLLQQHTPMWLAQMPSLLSSAEREALQRQLAGSTSQRMLRELANLLTVLTAERPLVLVLEDLHWSDPSTVALLAYLARWPERLRLLVLGTYRPVEVLRGKHPLVIAHGELAGQGLCSEVALPLLTEAAIAEYLRRRAPHDVGLSHLAPAVYHQTEGHPLFVVATVEEWLTQGHESTQNSDRWAPLSPAMRNGGMPQRLRQFVSAQMGRLAIKEQRLLEAASVAGEEFAAVEVAAALTADEVETEERCEALARQRQFLRPAGVSEWPDGTVAARYRFSHAVYQTLWQERVKAGKWRRYHQQIGERKEAAYGERAGEIAAELALHFEQGREYRKAIRYFHRAAQMALTRSAHTEVIAHLTKGLTLLKHLPDASERVQQELDLRMTFGPALIATSAQAWAAPTVEKSYARTRELCRRMGETPQLVWTLHGLRVFHTTRGEVRIAYEFAEQSLRLAQNLRDSVLLMWGHGAMGETLYWLGELTAAQEHCERAIALYDKSPLFSWTWIDPKVAFLSYTAVTLWMRGYPDQALARVRETLTLARELSHPFSIAWALNSTGRLHQYRGEARAAQVQAEALITLATEQEFPYWLVPGTSLRGWALIEQGQEEEGLAQMRQGQASEWITKARRERPHYLTLQVEAWRRGGCIEEGLAVLTDAISRVEKTGDRAHCAELYRLKGELILQKFKVESSMFQVQTTGKKRPSWNP